MADHEGRAPSYLDVVTPLIVLAVLVGGAVSLFGHDAMDGPMQVAIMMAAMVAAGILLKNGHSWDSIGAAGRRGVSSVVGAIFILFAVGALIGTWNMAGTIPTLVYYGLQIIRPDLFYVTSLLVAAIISMSVGSSWTTAGTIGVGLVGLASLAGASPEITAGAVISGAYTGDKLSPLSETTILAAQLSGNDIYVHLRHQAWVSVPAFAIAAVGFFVLGMTGDRLGVSAGVMDSELMRLNELFWITPINLLPLILLVILSVRKVPAALALMSAALFASLLACFTQPHAVQMAFPDADGGVLSYIRAVWQVIASGYHSGTGIEQVDYLLSRGGMASMLPTIWLIIAALAFGSILDEFGFLSKLITPIMASARKTGSLIATTVGTAFGLNVVAGDQYVAIVLPIKLFRAEYEKRHLATKNLSRAVSNGGIVTSPLVPWNSCGAFMAATLGVPTLAYVPFALFNFASPILEIIYGYIGFKIAPADSKAAPAETPTGTSTGGL